MADDDDSAYFERRLNHCLEKANLADDPAVASVHRGFATGYAKNWRSRIHRDYSGSESPYH